MAMQKEIEDTAQELLKSYEITDESLGLVRDLREAIIPRIGSMIDAFYVWLKPNPAFGKFFSDKDLLARVQKLQIEHWKELFNANINEAYLDKRKNVGAVHARIGLPPDLFCAGMHFSLNWITNYIRSMKRLTSETTLATLSSVAALVHLDTAVTVKAYSDASEPATITVTSAVSVRAAWFSYRIFADSFVETGTYDEDDPAELDITNPNATRVGGGPSSSPRNVLWIVIHIANNQTLDPRCTSAPTDYENFQTGQTGTGAGHAAECTADRELQEGIEDPSAWIVQGSVDNRRSATWAFWWEAEPPNYAAPPVYPPLENVPFTQYFIVLALLAVLVFTLAGAWTLKQKGRTL